MAHCFRGAIVGVSVACFLGMAINSAYGEQPARWKLVWHDEFRGPAGALPDPTKWVHDIGNGGDNPGWGNNELEQYTQSTGNVFQDGFGHLVIRANRTKDGTFTSGRIKTQGLFAFTYGRIEARIKIPFAKGIWPAFWMLGSDFAAVGWPACGEIDIMENFGAGNSDAHTNHGSLHGPGFPATGLTAAYNSPRQTRIAEEFHIYTAEWTKDEIEFFVDNRSYGKFNAANLSPEATWALNGKPFFLILNVAVGGAPAPVGYPDGTTRFPQKMIVSYVRVYRRIGD